MKKTILFFILYLTSSCASTLYDYRRTDENFDELRAGDRNIFEKKIFRKIFSDGQFDSVVVGTVALKKATDAATSILGAPSEN